jgi:molybdopterin-guanine dinucleotide biosynthesis protein A
MAIIPEGPSGLEPLCALYTRDCLPIIEAALESGDLRLSSMVACLPSVERIPARKLERLGNPSKLFFNVNSPEDLAIAETVHATR